MSNSLFQKKNVKFMVCLPSFFMVVIENVNPVDLMSLFFLVI